MTNDPRNEEHAEGPHAAAPDAPSPDAPSEVTSDAMSDASSDVKGDAPVDVKGDASVDVKRAAPSEPPTAAKTASEPPPAASASAPPPAAELAAPAPKPKRSWFALPRDGYFSFDRRTLGFSRLLIGFYLLGDLFRHGMAWMDMYSSEGVLPTTVNLFRPQAYGAFTIFNAFNTPVELRALFAVMFVTFFCYFIGYKTKVAQVASLIFITGMNGRVLLIENGGYVVENLLLLWTCFLPLGDRFSLDEMLASWKRRREATEDDLNDRSSVLTERQRSPHVSVLGPVLVIQIAAIYFFNVVHKTGPAWRNGTAVHYVLYVDRMVNPIIGLTRDYLPNFAILIMTKTTLACEAGIPVTVLSPLGRRWARRLTIVMMNMLHLGFGFSMVLGPFAWACCLFSTLLFSDADWEIAYRTMRRAHRARVVLFDPRSPGALFVCRLLKRLDHFELLTFRASPDSAPLGLAVQEPGSAVITRGAAVADMVAALPLGPIIAWLLRAPGIRGLVDAICGFIERHDASRTFGLRLAPSFDAGEPSAVRRGLGFVTGFGRELMILAMFVGAVNQAAVELWVVNRRVKIPQPEPTRLLAHKMRFLQGWFMFSPNPVMDDGTIIVDAITIDGRHIDPFMRKEPNFDLLHAKSFGYNQIWSDYFNRMHLPGNSYYREAMKEYIFRLPKRTGRPEDTIVSGDVYWVQDMNPKWSEIESYKFEKVKLFSFENPAVKPPEAPPSAEVLPVKPARPEGLPDILPAARSLPRLKAPLLE